MELEFGLNCMGDLGERGIGLTFFWSFGDREKDGPGRLYRMKCVHACVHPQGGLPL